MLQQVASGVRVIVGSVLIALVACFIQATSAVAAVGPSVNSFEIDGDYGSVIAANGDIYDGGYSATYSQLGTGQKWVQTGAISDVSPYMGQNMYVASAGPSTGTDRDRSEQKMVYAWSPDDGPMYCAFSFCVPATTPTPTGWLFLSQWWQDSTLNPPIFMAWNSGTLTLVRRYSTDTNPNKREVLVDMGPVVRDQWYHFVASVTWGPEGDGAITLRQMDLATGLWDVKYQNDQLALGLKWKGDGSGLPADMENFTWKLGMYRSQPQDGHAIYFDNVRYANRWYRVTKNKLTGYQKCVLNLGFEESAGTIANDTSYTRNPGGSVGDPYTDYNNDATLINGAAWSASGNVGRSLQLDGVDDYARVPLDTVDFDTGNYITTASWFKTDTAQENKALICIDEYSTTYKVYLSLNRDNKLRFAVRHPDNTVSEVIYTSDVTLCDDIWRHAMGTYNRYAEDGQRLKLYLDGVLVASSTGVDKALLRGDNYLYVGKFSGNYFQGSLDEVQVFNYEYTPIMTWGDANNDGQINLADLQILGDHWQSSSANWALGDFTGDGLVNLADLQVLGDHWGYGGSLDISFDDALALAGLSIPEPTVVSLLIPALMLLPRRRSA